MLDPVIKSIEVPCNQAMAFKVFVEDLSSWWPMHKNSVSAMQGKVSQSVSVEAKEGGKVVEIAHDGEEHQWATISTYNPDDEFSMLWHIGIPASDATVVTVRFTALSENKTQVVLTHSGWEAFADKASAMREGYDSGWVGVFEQAYLSACQSA